MSNVSFLLLKWQAHLLNFGHTNSNTNTKIYTYHYCHCLKRPPILLNAGLGMGYFLQVQHRLLASGHIFYVHWSSTAFYSSIARVSLLGSSSVCRPPPEVPFSAGRKALIYGLLGSLETFRSAIRGRKSWPEEPLAGLFLLAGLISPSREGIWMDFETNAPY